METVVALGPEFLSPERIAAAGLLALLIVVFTESGLLIGFFLPRLWLGRRKSSRLKAFNKQLPDTITLIANALRAGSSFLQAIELVVRESRPPISTEFGRVIRDLYLAEGWTGRAWTWHEAADTRLFRTPCSENERHGLVWIGNWGDGERESEITDYLLRLRRAGHLVATREGKRGKRLLLIGHLDTVFEKDSPLVPFVNQALANLRANGTLDALAEEWLPAAPELRKIAE